MDFYEVPNKSDEDAFEKALIRLVRVAKFLMHCLEQAMGDDGPSARRLKEYRLTLMIAKRIITAWEAELGIEN